MICVWTKVFNRNALLADRLPVRDDPKKALLATVGE
jgi:hypothetical protein